MRMERKEDKRRFRINAEKIKEGFGLIGVRGEKRRFRIK